jgi:hypothetical protein
LLWYHQLLLWLSCHHPASHLALFKAGVLNGGISSVDGLLGVHSWGCSLDKMASLAGFVVGFKLVLHLVSCALQALHLVSHLRGVLGWLLDRQWPGSSLFWAVGPVREMLQIGCICYVHVSFVVVPSFDNLAVVVPL